LEDDEAVQIKNTQIKNFRSIIAEEVTFNFNGKTVVDNITGIEVTFFGYRKFIIGAVLGGNYRGMIYAMCNVNDSPSEIYAVKLN
jgi:hypothetical protein